MVTPASSRCANSRDRIIASALLLITISSKQSSLRLLGDGRGDRRDRIALLLRPLGAQPLVHLEHEFVEMDAALGRDSRSSRRPGPSASICRARPRPTDRRRRGGSHAARRAARGCCPCAGFRRARRRAGRARRPRAPGRRRAAARRRRPGPGSARRPRVTALRWPCAARRKRRRPVSPSWTTRPREEGEPSWSRAAARPRRRAARRSGRG